VWYPVFAPFGFLNKKVQKFTEEKSIRLDRSFFLSATSGLGRRSTAGALFCGLFPVGHGARSQSAGNGICLRKNKVDTTALFHELFIEVPG
jgi:hypothetical protein